MGRDTNIEWCDSTINGSSGCDGCELWGGGVKTCYAGTLQEARLAKSLPALYSADFKEVRMIPGRFARAAAWSDLRGTDRPEKPWLNGMPRCIFVGDMGDFLSASVTDEYLGKELLGAIMSKQGQRHFWMLLTKRPWRLAVLAEKWGGLPDNVMAMTTITDQRTADVRVQWLARVECKWKGLSCEPLLGAVDFRKVPGFNKIGLSLTHWWVIAGGESGAGARPMHPDWVRGLRDQCANARVPFLFKQWGCWSPEATEAVLDRGKWLEHNWPDGHRSYRTSKEGAGRVLDGVEHNGFPALAIEGGAA